MMSTRGAAALPAAGPSWSFTTSRWRRAAALFCVVVDGILMAGLWLLVMAVTSSTEKTVKGRRWPGATMAEDVSWLLHQVCGCGTVIPRQVIVELIYGRKPDP
jgi:hypothetical protein